MKLLALIAVAAVVVGGIYHAEISQYFAHLADASSNGGGGGSSVVNSIQNMGNSENALLGGVDNALNR